MELAEYQTPKGFYDLPYIHVYDGDALTDGLNYSNINTGAAQNEAGFVLRQIMGADKLAARVQFRDSFAPLTGTTQGFVMPRTYPVAPERYVPPYGLLGMDLFTVARANRVAGQVTIFFAQIAFQGVRRYVQPAGANLSYPAPSAYPYVERPFSYEQTLTVGWAGTDAEPRHFTIPITEGCDFELQRITIVRTSQAGVPTNAIPDSEIKLQLYEQFGKQLSNAPVLDVYLNDAASGLVHFYNPVFPVPAVLYKRQSFIRFDVISLLTAPMLPSIYQICFHGVRRMERGQ